MPTTQLGTMTSSANAGISTVTSPSAAQQIRFVDVLVESLDPMDFSLTRNIGFGKAVSNRKLEWTDERFAPTEDVAGAAATNTATTITVTNFAYFQQYDVLRIGEENLWVSAVPTSTTLTVVRGFGGTTAAAIAAGDRIRIVGTAVP